MFNQIDVKVWGEETNLETIAVLPYTSDELASAYGITFTLHEQNISFKHFKSNVAYIQINDTQYMLCENPESENPQVNVMVKSMLPTASNSLTPLLAEFNIEQNDCNYVHEYFTISP